jgi:glutaminase
MSSISLPVLQYLQALHEKHKSNRTGSLANYIPELARVDPDRFGLSFVTMDGHIYEAGDANSLFTIQSISKAIIYALALEDHGREEVLRRIGVEPSGEAFNSIAFDERNNRPFNPMVNAGAIASTAMVKGSSHAERLDRILNMFEAFAGRRLSMDDDVYRSESSTGHRNRAIAFLELNSGMIDGNVEDHLDLYFRQCSLLVNAVDLAIIGATFANGGLNPLTGERAVQAEHVRSVLSVMNTCGMYDYAGGWQFDVGLPAKSGVGGGITAVLPGHLGIGVFSPRLDAVGNSERGVKVCEDISRNFRLHLFEDRGPGQDPVRRFYRGTEVRSSRMRRQVEVAALDHDGHAIAVCELQGDITFVEAEKISRRIGSEVSSLAYLILDMSRVRRMHPISMDLLRMLQETLTTAGIEMAVVSPEGVLRSISRDHGFPSVDSALEHFEDTLIARVLEAELSSDQQVALGDFVLFSDWDHEAVTLLQAHTTRREVSQGEVIIQSGTSAKSLYFLTKGRVDVSIPISAGMQRRVSTIDAGNVFGELALFGQGRRTADVVAAAPVEVLELTADKLGVLGIASPELRIALFEAVGRSLADRLARANREIQALSR